MPAMKFNQPRQLAPDLSASTDVFMHTHGAYRHTCAVHADAYTGLHARAHTHTHTHKLWADLMNPRLLRQTAGPVQVPAYQACKHLTEDADDISSDTQLGAARPAVLVTLQSCASTCNLLNIADLTVGQKLLEMLPAHSIPLSGHNWAKSE